MKKLIIFGNKNFAELMHYFILHDTDNIISCFTVNKDYIIDTSLLGLPVVPFEEIENNYSPDEFEMLIAIGYSKMNNVRKKVFYDCKNKGYKIASYIHSSVCLSEPALGEGNIILENTVIQPFVRIGDCNLVWYNVAIAHNDVLGNFNTLAGSTSLSGNVIIGDNCFLGNRSMVFDGVKIEDYTLVGAGAIVREETKPYSVIVPARSLVLDSKNSLQMNI